MYIYNDLISLSGFQSLRHEQRQVIHDSLLIQEKAQRGKPEAISFIDEWFCHAGIVALERGGFFPDIIQKNSYGGIPASFTIVEGMANFNVFFHTTLQQEFSEPLPRIIHILKQHVGYYKVYHSILLLGIDHKGDFITWEKQAAGKPFRISNLEQLVSEFPGWGWGSRALRNYLPLENNLLHNGS